MDIIEDTLSIIRLILKSTALHCTAKCYIQ